MQSVTGTLAAALAANETTVAVRVLVDWNRSGSYTDTYDDLSLLVDDLSVERTISSDVPDAAQVLTGGSDGSATLTLSGPDAVAIFSPYTSTLSSVQRMGAPCQIDLAFATTAGTEYLPMLRGRITRVTTDGDAGTVTLQVIDQWESVTRSVQVPVAVADDRAAIRPGLNAGWVMDWILRQNGFYCTPPVRSSCVLSATMHGSTTPEVGSLLGSAVNFYSGADADKPRSGMTYSPGTLGPLALNLRQDAAANLYTTTTYLAAAPIGVDSGLALFVEGWWLCDGSNITMLNATSTGTNGLSSNITIGVSGTTMLAALTRSGSTQVSNTAGTVSAGWHYLACHCAFTTSGATVNVRVDGTTSTFTLVPTTGINGVGQASGNGTTTGITLAGFNASVEGYQVTTEAYSASMWSNAFTRTAILEQSLNELTATPAVDTKDSRDLLQSLAAAEAGIVTFDESGVFRFYNRNHLAQATLATTLTTTDNLASIGTTEAMDGVRNVVTVPARPLKVETTDSTVWALTEATAIPARGMVVIPVEFENPVLVLRTDVRYYSAIPYAGGSGYKLTSGSGFRASTTADGTGSPLSNLTFSVVQDGSTSATVTVRNPNSVTAYLVNNTDQDPSDEITQGSELLLLRGRSVVPAVDSDAGDGTVAQVVRNDTSIAVFGEQPLDLDDSPWRQSSTSALDLAGHLAYSLGLPHPVMDTIEVIPDPRLQLGDRVHITDSETGLKVDRDFAFAGYTVSASEDGLTQSIDVRELGVPLFWDTGTWDSSNWQ